MKQQVGLEVVNFPCMLKKCFFGNFIQRKITSRKVFRHFSGGFNLSCKLGADLGFSRDGIFQKKIENFIDLFILTDQIDFLSSPKTLLRPQF